jgi:hypothetical protein
LWEKVERIIEIESIAMPKNIRITKRRRASEIVSTIYLIMDAIVMERANNNVKVN